jgi:hypothetical protein
MELVAMPTRLLKFFRQVVAWFRGRDARLRPTASHSKTTGAPRICAPSAVTAAAVGTFRRTSAVAPLAR